MTAEPQEREDLLVDLRDDSVGIITLNRPHAANTFTAALVDGFEKTVGDLVRKRARVLVITGNGRHFCAGADLKAVAAGHGPRLGDTRFIDQLEDIRIPVIAALNGSAIGGGCELALACDLRVMASGATIGLPEVRFGGLPAGGGTQRLPRIVGIGRAKQMLMLGTPVPADEALAMGLVNAVVPSDQVLPYAIELARELCRRPAYALESVKFLVNRSADLDLSSGLKLEIYVARKMATSEQRKDAQRQAGEAEGGAYAGIFKET
jgi:enoyl-CoA hydratase/carnithine racemase